MFRSRIPEFSLERKKQEKRKKWRHDLLEEVKPKRKRKYKAKNIRPPVVNIFIYKGLWVRFLPASSGDSCQCHLCAPW